MSASADDTRRSGGVYRREPWWPLYQKPRLFVEPPVTIGGEAVASLPVVTISAPSGAATGAASAVGGLVVVQVAPLDGFAQGAGEGAASGDLPVVGLVAPSAIATGGAAVAAALAGLTLVAPDGQASGEASVFASLTSVTIYAPAGIAVGNAAPTLPANTFQAYFVGDVGDGRFLDVWRDVTLEVRITQRNGTTGFEEPAVGLTNVDISLAASELAISTLLSTSATERSGYEGRYYVYIQQSALVGIVDALTFPTGSEIFILVQTPQLMFEPFRRIVRRTKYRQ